MPVNLVQYRGTVEVFNNRKFFDRLQWKKLFEPTFFSDVFLNQILLFTLQYVGVTFYIISGLNPFKTKSA